MNTMEALKMHPHGMQLQQIMNHARDARSATPTKKIGYLSQSGMPDISEADTSAMQDCKQRNSSTAARIT
jgi:hypothetical protein